MHEVPFFLVELKFLLIKQEQTQNSVSRIEETKQTAHKRTAREISTAN